MNVSIAKNQNKNYTLWITDLAFEFVADKFFECRFRSARKFIEYCPHRTIYTFEDSILPDGAGNLWWRVSIRHVLPKIKNKWEEVFNSFCKAIDGHFCYNCNKEVLHIGDWSYLCVDCHNILS